MAVVQVVNAVQQNGKQSYQVEADFMPMPDGSGLVFKATNLLDANGLYKATLIPWSNIASMTTDVPPAFFDPPAENDNTDQMQ